MLHKMLAGAILMAMFMGLAQEMRISESETGTIGACLRWRELSGSAAKPVNISIPPLDRSMSLISAKPMRFMTKTGVPSCTWFGDD